MMSLWIDSNCVISICDDNISGNKPSYVTGDFNINFHVDTNDRRVKDQMTQLMDSHYMKQRITKFTRVEQNSKSLIDLFFTERKNKDKIVVLDSDPVADHKTLKIEKSIVRKNKRVVKIKDRTKYSKDALNSLMCTGNDWELEQELPLRREVKVSE